RRQYRRHDRRDSSGAHAAVAGGHSDRRASDRARPGAGAGGSVHRGGTPRRRLRDLSRSSVRVSARLSGCSDASTGAQGAAMTTSTDPDVTYATERCWVRNWRPGDVDRVFDLYSRWEVAKWLGAAPKAMEDRAGAERLVERWGAQNLTEPSSGRWAVERKAD